jgi:Large-conductance mechanosensitive channel, MscL
MADTVATARGSSSAPGIRPVLNREGSVLSDFKKFVLRGNVVDLAVAVGSASPSPP